MYLLVAQVFNEKFRKIARKLWTPLLKLKNRLFLSYLEGSYDIKGLKGGKQKRDWTHALHTSIGAIGAILVSFFTANYRNLFNSTKTESTYKHLADSKFTI